MKDLLSRRAKLIAQIRLIEVEKMKVEDTVKEELIHARDYNSLSVNWSRVHRGEDMSPERYLVEEEMRRLQKNDK